MRNYRRFIVAVTAALSGSAFTACDDVSMRPLSLGAYTSQLCEAIGPFEEESQIFGQVFGRRGIDVKSRDDRRLMMNILTVVIVDARRAIKALKLIGAPDIANGGALASGMIATFNQVAISDAVWRSRLHDRYWTWLKAGPVMRQHLRTALGGLVLVGRQIERLPHTRERQNAMAHSPVCRYVFGPVSVGEEENSQNS